MGAMASQITSLTIVYSTVYSDADQRKHQSSASLAFVWGIHRDRWIPRTKGQLRGKCFHLMTSSNFKGTRAQKGPTILVTGGRFKNAYGLLNLRALKIAMLYKNRIFQCMSKIFCVEFEMVPLKFHTKYLTHTLKDVNFIHRWNFKSS